MVDYWRLEAGDFPDCGIDYSEIVVGGLVLPVSLEGNGDGGECIKKYKSEGYFMDELAHENECSISGKRREQINLRILCYQNLPDYNARDIDS